MFVLKEKQVKHLRLLVLAIAENAVTRPEESLGLRDLEATLWILRKSHFEDVTNSYPVFSVTSLEPASMLPTSTSGVKRIAEHLHL